MELFIILNMDRIKIYKIFSHLVRSYYPTFSTFDNYTDAYTTARVQQGSVVALTAFVILLGLEVV